MRLNVNVTSQGRLLDALLFLPDSSEGPLPALLFEGTMTGATNQITEYVAKEVADQNFVCLVMDHSFYSEEEGLAQPWESPSKRLGDLKAALQFLQHHNSIDPQKIVGVGVSVGAEYLAQICREDNIIRGLIILEGPFDDSQNMAKDLDIPTIVIDETHLDSAVDEIVLWTRTLFDGAFVQEEPQVKVDWSVMDE
ncbi:alpha/beta hydrolase family protein [Bdellovibrio bacteriovorus]|uniref:alpha/beta hydrolase family protein n=1 Tax=Bdellovibrio bacteriovorus TaxID=959 RepID=UPI0035A620DE